MHLLFAVSVPLNGYITVRQHLEDLSPPEISIPKKKRRKLPSGIKERHCFMSK
jgi:hypothetical protein